MAATPPPPPRAVTRGCVKWGLHSGKWRKQQHCTAKKRSRLITKRNVRSSAPFAKRLWGTAALANLQHVHRECPLRLGRPCHEPTGEVLLIGKRIRHWRPPPPPHCTIGGAALHATVAPHRIRSAAPATARPRGMHRRWRGCSPSVTLGGPPGTSPAGDRGPLTGKPKQRQRPAAWTWGLGCRTKWSPHHHPRVAGGRRRSPRNRDLSAAPMPPPKTAEVRRGPKTEEATSPMRRRPRWSKSGTRPLAHAAGALVAPKRRRASRPCSRGLDGPKAEEAPSVGPHGAADLGDLETAPATNMGRACAGGGGSVREAHDGAGAWA